ncbi:MAG TPA: MFS transporter [Xanthobacteraceae bacterium]|nr:MFS transporter [Xanthobacteraceae bacterium]
MTIAASTPDRPADEAAAKRRERRALGVACGAHALHDGYTDLIWVALPIWQAEFGLTYAAVGALRMVYSGTMASLQIPATYTAERIGAGVVLALGTAFSGLCYCLAGIGDGFWWLVAALFLGGVGAATQHPIGSALVTRVFTGARALTVFGTYNFAGDVGKVLFPAAATTLILFMPWRPAYALLGLIGIAAAIGVFVLTPRLGPEPAAEQKAPAQDARGATDDGRLRAGFRILAALGIADSVVRAAFFVLLPFLLIGKGATVVTAGLALTLVFAGGAAGKLACGWIARSVGMVATVAVAQALTAAGMFAVLLLPLSFALVLLPLLGVALNGVTTVIYGSVPNYAAPERRTHALSVFYTLAIGSAALAPPLSGLVGDLIGISGAVVVVSLLTAATIPLAFALKPPSDA